MKKLITIFSICAVLTACSTKPELKGRVVLVNGFNQAFTSVKIGNIDSIVVCYPKSKYETFKEGQNLTLVYEMGRYESK